MVYIALSCNNPLIVLFATGIITSFQKAFFKEIINGNLMKHPAANESVNRGKRQNPFKYNIKRHPEILFFYGS